MNRIGFLFAAILVLLHSALCPAADKMWVGGSGEWSNPPSWSPPGVPAPTNSVFISSGVVFVRSNITVASLHLAGGTLQSLVQTNTITCTNFFWAAGTIVGGGTTFIPPGGTLMLTNPTQVTLASNTLLNAGFAIWTGFGGLSLNSSARILNDGIWDAQASGYMFGFQSAFINSGTLMLTNPNVFTTFYAPVTNRGTIMLKNASLRGLYGFTQTRGRIILENARLDADGGLRVFGGSVSGDGQINGQYLINRGTLLPGRPIGTLRMPGNFTNTGHIYIDVQTGPGPSATDLIQVPFGSTRLGGTLHVCFHGFVPPQAGLSFTFLTAPSISGGFAGTDGFDLGGGSVLALQQSAGAVTLATSNAVRNDGVIALVGCGEGRHQVRFTGEPSASYRIEGATDLGNWTTLLTTNPTSGVTYYLDTNALSLPRQFYRAVRETSAGP